MQRATDNMLNYVLVQFYMEKEEDGCWEVDKTF